MTYLYIQNIKTLQLPYLLKFTSTNQAAGFISFPPCVTTCAPASCPTSATSPFVSCGSSNAAAASGDYPTTLSSCVTLASLPATISASSLSVIASCPSPSTWCKVKCAKLTYILIKIHFFVLLYILIHFLLIEEYVYCIRRRCDSINGWLCNCSYRMCRIRLSTNCGLHTCRKRKHNISLLCRRSQSNNNNNCKHVGCCSVSSINIKLLQSNKNKKTKIKNQVSLASKS